MPAISECSTLEEAVRRYEETMFARAEIAGRVANEVGLNLLVAPDAPADILAFFREAMSGEHA